MATKGALVNRWSIPKWGWLAVDKRAFSAGQPHPQVGLTSGWPAPSCSWSTAGQPQLGVDQRLTSHDGLRVHRWSPPWGWTSC